MQNRPVSTYSLKKSGRHADESVSLDEAFAAAPLGTGGEG
jgi:hypothetical protein